MHHTIRLLSVIGSSVCLLLTASCDEDNGAIGTELSAHISLPDGFSIDYYCENLLGARSMTMAEDGTIFVGTRREGKVYAIRDIDQDWQADSVYTIANGMNMPNGVAYKDGALYVAEINRILRYDDILNNLENPSVPKVVFDQLPSDRHHGWKFIAFGPDGKLYVPVGAPCNICLSDNPVYASITRLNPDGSGHEVFAHGIRNTVGFDWHPETGDLWFTDNGRDWLGDDLPPDELNRASLKGQHFGYPFIHGDDIADPDIGLPDSPPTFTMPAWNLNAHVAALGMRFYNGNQFPVEYKDAIFIAEHGSWNRTTPDGYRVMVAKLDGNKVKTVEVFASGWLSNSEVLGRPVDVLELDDGSILVSDDHAGAIYRISYTG